MKYAPVALNKCKSYDRDTITELIKTQFEAINVNRELINGKRIVIKPNLVMNKPPEFAATTHPAVVTAVVRNLKKMGAASIIIAESSGGPYTEALIKSHYKSCGMADVSHNEGIDLNTDTSFGIMQYQEGVKCRTFNVIKPIIDADIIINICKLKTHSLTKMSAGVKNLFGVVPGIEKFEMHARFPEQNDFVEMICDLCSMLCESKEMITVCDGITGMEGNGPTGGTPKNFGVLLSSRSPYSLDCVCESILGFNGTVPMLNAARARNLAPQSVDTIDVIGETPESCKVSELVLPDTQKFNILRSLPNLFGGKAAKFFEPKPQIDRNKCIGCGVCERSCPKHTITIKNRKAKINYSDCIRCYCCQELCPINSVKIKQNFIIKIIQ
ncbi:MAG: DUF362 domain-containing protein [Clostridia bacterium]|nr:DUF362 domain-containing protein [Clostridia bacterium]